MKKLIAIIFAVSLATLSANSQVFFQGSFGPKYAVGGTTDQTLSNYKSTTGFTLHVGYDTEGKGLFTLLFDYGKFKNDGTNKVNISANGSSLPEYQTTNPFSITTIGFSGEQNFYSYRIFDAYATYSLGLGHFTRDVINYKNSTTAVQGYEEISSWGVSAFAGVGVNANVSDNISVFWEINYAYGQFDDASGNSKTTSWLPMKLGIKYFTNWTY